MRAHRFRRANRRTAEQSLRGAPDRVRTDGPDALNDLLAAASAPARRGELAGEEAAVVAFRAAHLAEAVQPRRQSMLKVTLAKVLTVKIAAVAVATLAVGGVAVAAATGNLPNQGNPTPPPAVTVPSLPNRASGSSGEGEGPNAPDKNKDDKGTAPGKPNGDNASQSQSSSLAGLCNAFTAGAGADQGKALENPAFTALITAAGGKDKVPAYCADLAGKPGKSGNPPGKPGTPGNGNGPDKDHSNGNSNSNGNSGNGNSNGNGNPNGNPNGAPARRAAQALTQSHQASGGQSIPQTAVAAPGRVVASPRTTARPSSFTRREARWCTHVPSPSQQAATCSESSVRGKPSSSTSTPNSARTAIVRFWNCHLWPVSSRRSRLSVNGLIPAGPAEMVSDRATHWLFQLHALGLGQRPDGDERERGTNCDVPEEHVGMPGF